MGWSDGTDIARAVVYAIKSNVKNDVVRKKIYLPIIRALEDADWDTQNEATGIDPVFDELLGIGEE